MARRLPSGTIFRGSYAPGEDITYDKPQGDYEKIVGIAETVLPVADKIITPLAAQAWKGITSLFDDDDDEDIKKGAQGYQKQIAKSESSNRSAVASKMLGKVPDVTLKTPDLLRDRPEPQKKRKVFPAIRENDVTSDHLRSLGLRPGTRAWETAYLTLMKKAENLPQDVWTDLTDAQVRKLYEDPSYTGEDLVRDIKEVEESVAEQPMLPDPMQRQTPAFDRLKDPRLDPALSRAERMQQSRMDQLRSQARREMRQFQPFTGAPAELNLMERQAAEEMATLLTEGEPESGPLVNQFIFDDLIAKQGFKEGQLRELNEILKYLPPEERRKLTSAYSTYDPSAQKQLSVADKMSQMRELKERIKLEEMAPQLEPAQRGVPEAKREADAQVEELYAGVTETKDPVESVETAVEVVQSSPGAVQAKQDFDKGLVRSIERMPFSQVRAMATLSDPRALTSKQISAFAERYRDEAIPTSIFQVFSGEHKDEAEKQMRKELGLYAGVTTKEERRQAASSAAQMEQERLKQRQQNLRKQADIEVDLLGYGLDKIKTQSDVNKATSDIAKNYAMAKYNQSGVKLRNQQRLKIANEARVALVDALKAERSWNRIINQKPNPNRVRVKSKFLNVNGKLTLVPGVQTRSGWYAVGSADFQQKLKEGKIPLSSKQIKQIKSDFKWAKDYGKEPSKRDGKKGPSAAKVKEASTIANQARSSLENFVETNMPGYKVVKTPQGWRFQDEEGKNYNLSNVTLRATKASDEAKAREAFRRLAKEEVEASAKHERLQSELSESASEELEVQNEQAQAFPPQEALATQEAMINSLRNQSRSATSLNAERRAREQVQAEVAKVMEATGSDEGSVLNNMRLGKTYDFTKKKWVSRPRSSE